MRLERFRFVDDIVQIKPVEETCAVSGEKVLFSPFPDIDAERLFEDSEGLTA